MKVLLFFSSLELGGAERQGINFAKYLKSKKIEVSIIGLGNDGKVKNICEKENIDCYSLNSKINAYNIRLKIRHYFKLKKLTSEELALLPLANDLAKFIKANKVDVCIAYCTTANTLLGIAKKDTTETKCVWYQRDAGIFDSMSGLQVRSAKNIDVFLSNSIVGQDWLKKAYDVEAILVNNGVELSPAVYGKDTWRAKLNCTDTDVICTMIANLSKEKDHLFLLKVLSEMINRKNIKFVFAGRYDSQYEYLKHYVEEKKLGDSVIFLGQIDDVSGLIYASDICLFGAKSEGSPNGVIECELGGLPVFSTNVVEIRDVVSADNYEYLYEMDNVMDAVNKLTYLINNADERIRIGKSNLVKAKKAYDYETNFGKLLKIISK